MKKFIGFAKNLYSGRIGRLDYFLSALFLFVAMIPIYSSIIVASALSSRNDLVGSLATFATLIIFMIIIFYGWLVFSVHVRRLHDAGMSGWYALLFLIPLVGFLFFIAMLFKKGDEGENEYGAIIGNVGFFKKMLNI